MLKPQNVHSEVILFFRTRPDIVFQQLLMNDEGQNGDTFAGDGIFSAQLQFQDRDVDYYIYAQNFYKTKSNFKKILSFNNN